ncbi:hypothetical protein Tco_0897875 [Tanacetum coccineum]
MSCTKSLSTTFSSIPKCALVVKERSTIDARKKDRLAQIRASGWESVYYRAIGERWRKERVLEHKRRSLRKSTESGEYDVSF